MKRINKIMAIMLVVSVTGLLAGFGPWGGIPSAGAGTVMVPANFSALAEGVKPGVVNIRTERTIKGGDQIGHLFRNNPFGEGHPFNEFFKSFPGNDQVPNRKQQGLGSGFIIDRDGYIVTNNHVIEKADQITVKLANGEEYDATLVGRDPKTDLALIRIDASSKLTPLELGDSDSLNVGSWVVAVGSPFGLEQTVTAGIVSAKGRVIGSGPYDDFIQTDASINPGNSGGPLVDMKGTVIGINTAIIASGQGIGFAIPVNLARGIIAQLKDAGEVTRGWLGVQIQDITKELKEYYALGDRKGVLVSEVFEDSPAEKAGIMAEDIITAVDGTEVSSGKELSRTVAAMPAGKEVDVTLLRKGMEKTVTVTMAKLTDETVARAEMKGFDELGIKMGDLTPELARQFGHDENSRGVIVLEVDPLGNAKKAGIQSGDIILGINQNTLSSAADYRDLMNQTRKGEAVQLLIKRPNAGFIVAKIMKG